MITILTINRLLFKLINITTLKLHRHNLQVRKKYSTESFKCINHRLHGLCTADFSTPKRTCERSQKQKDENCKGVFCITVSSWVCEKRKRKKKRRKQKTEKNKKDCYLRHVPRGTTPIFLSRSTDEVVQVAHRYCKAEELLVSPSLSLSQHRHLQPRVSAFSSSLSLTGTSPDDYFY